MSELAALQLKFLHYLREADESIVSDIAGADELSSRRRLSIYYNAYRVRLRDSIDVDHPVLGIYLGDDGFETMVRDYIDTCPSQVRSLRHFCDGLPNFLASHPPFSQHPILADIARFERLLMDVFDAADAHRLPEQYLTELAAEDWPGLRFTLHPSLRFFSTAWNSVEIWQAVKAEREPPAADDGEMRHWLVWRGRNRLTEFRSLPVDEYVLLEQVGQDADFSALCEALLEWYKPEEVAPRALHILRSWFSHGLLLGGDAPVS